MNQLAIKQVSAFDQLIEGLKNEIEIHSLHEVIGALASAVELRQKEIISGDISNLYKNLQLVTESLEAVKILAEDLVSIERDTEIRTPVTYSRRRIAKNDLLIAVSDIEVMR